MKQKFITINKEISRQWFNPSMECEGINKPVGGLWASPYIENGEYISEWHDFLINEMGSTPSLGSLFELHDNARVYVIDCLEDLEQLPFIKILDCLEQLDFNEIRKNYDAIFLTSAGQWRTRLSRPYNLYGWDVESLLILNYDCINEDTIEIIDI